MPNWCAGTLKIKGTEENILKFLEEKLTLYNYVTDTHQDITYYSDNGWKVIDETFLGMELWVKDSRRMFIVLDGDMEYFDTDKEEEVVKVCYCKQAWNIDVGLLLDLSEKYNISFKIYAFERGAEFNRDIEVCKGKIVKDDFIEYDNYFWECIDPMQGG